MTTIDLDFGEAGRQAKYVIWERSPDRQETAGDKSIGSDREKSEGRRLIGRKKLIRNSNHSS